MKIYIFVKDGLSWKKFCSSWSTLVACTGKI